MTYYRELPNHEACRELGTEEKIHLKLSAAEHLPSRMRNRPEGVAMTGTGIKIPIPTRIFSSFP